MYCFASARVYVSFIVSFYGLIAVGSAFADSPLVLSARVAIPDSQTYSWPIAMSAPAGDSQHLYVGYRSAARIAVHDRATGARLNNFFDVESLTNHPQEGLLSFAFHPNYEENGLFYTYIYRSAEQKGRVVEHRRSEENPLVYDPQYDRQIYEWDNMNSHNGGWIGFGPHDGYLYFTTGDGGANQGPGMNGLPAQDPFDVRGKLLRFDVAGDDFPDDDNFNYAIPPTNPFVESGGAPEVFALGLRHAFRAGFDRQTGDLYIGDVGSNKYEEINFLPAGTNGGQNFGWRPYEGFEEHPNFLDDPRPENPVFPIHVYPRGNGAAVIGGLVYRGEDFPALQGTYFFGDNVQRTISSFAFDGTNVVDLQDRTAEMFASGDLPNRVFAFAEDGLGELYFVTGADIWRIEAGLKGDYNDDGRVDAADYTMWRDQLGTDGSGLSNRDPAMTGVVGAADFDIWKQFFGNDAQASPWLASEPIPEPASGFVFTSAALLLMHRCRTRRVDRIGRG